MNALLCIGCNAYDHLRPILKGAEKDAQEVFGLLSIQNGFYDQELSCVLLSPDTSTIIAALNRVFSADKKIDVFTCSVLIPGFEVTNSETEGRTRQRQSRQFLSLCAGI